MVEKIESGGTNIAEIREVAGMKATRNGDDYWTYRYWK